MNIWAPPPFRIKFDEARDPYTARNALGIMGSGGGFITSVTAPLSVTGGNLSINLSGYQPILLISDTPPIGAADNSLWYESDTGKTFLRYNDGSSTQWILISNVNAVAMLPPVSAPVSDFLARTSGLNTTHINAYTALIDGLVADGIWAKLDLLHIYATQDSTTAGLNLVSTSFPATIHGSPTFTTDRGFTGVLNSSTVYISTGFNPVTASSPKFTRNSAHLSFWTTSNTGQNYNFPIGFNNAGATFICAVFPNTAEVGGSTYYRINSVNSGGFGASGTAFGHYIGTRSSSSAVNGYKDGSSHATDSVASVAVPSLEVFVLGQNNNGVAVGDSRQVTMVSIGSSLTATEAGNFYSRLRTYMTAVGVP